MFIELVDALRCVRSHEATWLVATSFEMRERDIVRGVLGCPICGARYPIERGVADLRPLDVADPGRAATGCTGAAPADPELALRVAALLDLTDPGGLVVLAGAWSAAAHALDDVTPSVHVLALDPPFDIASGGGVSVALTGAELPLRGGVARGVALDTVHAGERYVAVAAESLRAGGRLLAPVGAPLPSGVSELARDDRQWLAVTTSGAGAPVRLRGPRRSG